MFVWNYREMKAVHVEAIELLQMLIIISNTQFLVQVLRYKKVIRVLEETGT